MKVRLLCALALGAAIAMPVAAADAVSAATGRIPAGATIPPEMIDAVTSASVVQKACRQDVKPNGFTKSDKKKVLFVVGDPRHESVEWDLVNTAVDHFMKAGMEVEVRDLYKIGFNPVLPLESFFHAKDGFGKTPPTSPSSNPM